MFTNTTPVGAYRGAGRPEANYYMERLVDTAAREMGIDRVELRRRNHIPPEAMPYKAPTGTTYDSGDFPDLLEQGAGARPIGTASRQRKAESRARGKLRGRGIGDLSRTDRRRRQRDGRHPLRARRRRDDRHRHAGLRPGPRVAVRAGAGRSRLGIPFERIRLLQGDSDELIAGGGTGGSKSMMSSGNAIVERGDKVIEHGKQIAAHVLEAAAADIEFAPRPLRHRRHRPLGRHHGTGRPASRRAEAARGTPQSLDVDLVADDGPPSAFPNGCHIAEVEVDPDTGVVEVVRYTIVNDFGVVINPLLVDGQAHGGIVQGIGQALLRAHRLTTRTGSC